MPLASSFEQLYQDHYQRLTRRMYNIVRDQALAEDMVQDTFLKAWRARERVEAGNLTAWLTRIADRTAIDTLRRQQVARRYEQEPLSVTRHEALPDPDGLAYDEGWSDNVASALSHVPESYQQVVRLVIQGYGHQEIARILGCSVQASRVRLMRARQIFALHYHEVP